MAGNKHLLGYMALPAEPINIDYLRSHLVTMEPPGFGPVINGCHSREGSTDTELYGLMMECYHWIRVNIKAGPLVLRYWLEREVSSWRIAAEVSMAEEGLIC